MTDIDTAQGLKPFVYSQFHRKSYKRDWMRERRMDPDFLAKDAEYQRRRRQILRTASILARCGVPFEDQPGVK